MYRQPAHEFYNVWLRLTPEDKPNMISGFLKVSAFIVGPQDKQPVHQADEADQNQMDDLDDGLDEEQARRNERRGLEVLNAPSMHWERYSLVVKIYRGENLPNIDEKTACSPYLVCKTQNMQHATKPIPKNSMPSFNQAMHFPIYKGNYFYDDKIVMQLWDHSSFTREFFANIPENPTEEDVWNLKELLSKKGSMAPFWVNLYGVHPTDRGGKGANYRNKSSYMGRILMSLHLQRADAFETPFVIKGANHTQVPLSTTYRLYIDVYHLTNCDDLLQRRVWVQAQIGPKVTNKNFAKLKGGRKMDFEKIPIDALEVDLPQNHDQVPDLFVYLYTEGGLVYTTEQKLGYIRIPAKELFKQSKGEKQVKTRSIISITDERKVHGQLLMKAELTTNEKRVIQNPGVGKLWYFFAQIVSGYELVPSVPEEELVSWVWIEIGHAASSKETKIKTHRVPGRFPLYKYNKYFTITMKENVDFAQQMRVKVYRKKVNYFGGDINRQEVGYFSVPISSIKKLYGLPQYYDVIDSEGQMQGRVLARFFVVQKDQHMGDEQAKRIKEHLGDLYTPRFRANVQISMMGVRNLMNATESAEVRIGLTSHIGKPSTNNANYDPQATHKKNQKKDQRKTDKEFDSDGEDGSKIVQMRRNKQLGFVRPTKNPNFGQIKVLQNIELAQDPILWPFVIFEVFENGVQGGQASCRAIVPLILFGQEDNNNEMIDKHDIKLTLALNQVDVDREDPHEQEAQHPIRLYVKRLKEQRQSEKQDQKIALDYNLEIDSDKNLQYDDLQTPRGSIKNDSVNLYFLEKLGFMKYYDKRESQLQSKDKKLLDLLEIQLKEILEYENYGNQIKASRNNMRLMQDVGPGGAEPQEYGEELEEDDEEQNLESSLSLEEEFDKLVNGEDERFGDLKFEQKRDTRKSGKTKDPQDAFATDETSDPFEVNPVLTEFQLDFECTKKHKEQEREFKLKERAKKQKIQEQLNRMLDYCSRIKDNEKKVIITYQLTLIRKQIEALDEEEMDEKKFRGEIFEDEEKFDYGEREIFKNVQLEDQISPPFKSFSLFTNQSRNYEQCTIHNKFFTGGVKTESNAFLRCAISVKWLETFEDDYDDDNDRGSSYDDESDSDEESFSKKRRIRGQFEDDQESGIEHGGPGDNKSPQLQQFREQIEKYKNAKPYEQINALFPFKMFQQNYLDELIDTEKTYKIRVTILKCQNLSAVDNQTKFGQRIAGHQAMSSADPYIVVKVGDGINDPTTKQVKYIDDSENKLSGTLNPEFYKHYELDACFPDDWQLTIEIYDKAGFYRDSKMGETKIDLEYRRFASSISKAQVSKRCQEREIIKRIAQIREEEAAKQYEKREYKDNATKEARKAEEALLHEKKYLLQNALSMEEILPAPPVEWRQLRIDGKAQSQGLIEMWVEVLTAQEARKNPLQSLIKPNKKDDYELRLIVWSTRGIPMSRDGSMNVMVKITYSQDGKNDEAVSRETDVHRGVSDGNAKFNWRLKFPVQVPCEYPRLQIQVYDQNLLNENQLLASQGMDLKKAVKQMSQEADSELQMYKLPLEDPNDPNKEAGFIIFSLQMLSQIEAENNPVGTGWGEPNVDPVLEEVIEGRSIGAQLARMAPIQLPNVQLPQMNLYRNVMIMLGIIIVLGSVFFLMSYFKD